MLLLFLAYLGGVLTILSPCILPVLPFVFARADQPFRKTGLPLLAGMAVTFALVASLATVGAGWAVRANQFGRAAALILFGVFGLTLLFSSLAERISRPLVRLGNKLQNPDAGPGITNSFLLGIGTGLLWAPCAGPILGLILRGAAPRGTNAHPTLLLLAYAPGADRGMDINADGYGTVTEDRLYQLIRQHGGIQDRTFRIEFLVPDVQAYSFTFG